MSNCIFFNNCTWREVEQEEEQEQYVFIICSINLSQMSRVARPLFPPPNQYTAGKKWSGHCASTQYILQLKVCRTPGPTACGLKMLYKVCCYCSV